MSNRSLPEIALACGTDKAGHHDYAQIYDKYFTPLREQPLTLLELGIGGYHFPERGGQSLRMWHEYFPKAKIAGLDIHPKKDLGLDRVEIFEGSQDDDERLYEIIEKIGVPNIIIDDASHINPLTIESFEILFPVLATGGIYVIEDIETSWGEGWCSGCGDHSNYTFPSAVNMARRLINDVNVPYVTGYARRYDVTSIHFYKNIIFFFK